MKKKSLIILVAIITVSVTAYSFINKKTATVPIKKALNLTLLDTTNTNTVREFASDIYPDFIYDVSPRFEPISRTDVLKATSISDFISADSFKSIVTLKSVNLIIIKDERQTEIQEIGYTTDLTPKQLKLLQTADYNMQFNIRSEFTAINSKTGLLEHTFDSPHRSVVPEQQASYSLGKTVLVNYLREKGKKAVAEKNIDAKKLQPGKLHFTIATDGTIINVYLDRTTNYPEMDTYLKALIQNTPGDWLPAKDANGNIMPQELVVSYGLMGC